MSQNNAVARRFKPYRMAVLMRAAIAMRIVAGAIAVIIILAGALLVAPSTAHAGGPIRDAEIERLLREYTEPLIDAGNLSQRQVKLYLINDRSLNAFVAGGQNIFLNTGLILEADTPNMIIGVIAHEMGHIIGGHLSRTQPERTRTALYTGAAWILGLGSLLAGAGADIGSALLLGGTQLGQRSYLQYSRTQESAADQAAITLLERTEQSPGGLAKMMEKFEKRFRYLGASSGSAVDPYALTHPLPRERVDSLSHSTDVSPWKDQMDSQDWLRRHKMMNAKITGFLEDPKVTFGIYKAKDKSQPARYARAIAFFKSSDMGAALELLDGLIKESPKSPWLHELKGQVLFESGQGAKAIAPYERAVKLAPEEPLLHIGLASALLAPNKPKTTKRAIVALRRALRFEPDSAIAHFQLATAYGQLGNTARAQLALAEHYALLNQMRRASRHAQRARDDFDKDSPEWLRADDILRLTRRPAPPAESSR